MRWSERRTLRVPAEILADQTRIEHYFYATGSWEAEKFIGRENRTWVWGSDLASWQRIDTTWQARNVANNDATAGWLVNFVYPASTLTVLRDDERLQVDNTFDDGISNCTLSTCFGLLTSVTDRGSVVDQGQDTTPIDNVLTKTAYHKDSSGWLFPPKYTEKLDPYNGNSLLSCTRFYYDGAGGAGANNATLIRGLLTATSTAIAGTTTQCEGATAFTTSTSSYMEYETYGNPAQTYGNVWKSSVPVDQTKAPEALTAGSAFGWIPSGVAYGSSVYDSTHHIFPTSQANALGHTTTAVYDYVLGKPTSVTAPDTHAINIVYDSLGRVSRWYDNKDTDASPTVKYTYTWGTAPNKTLTEQRITHGAAPTRYTVSCMDGFGRETDHREQYRLFQPNSVRTDYDARGLKAVVTNPINIIYTSFQLDCSFHISTPSQRDRTTFAYDPLGNVKQTTFLAANQTVGPYTQANYNGQTTTFTDERFKTTTHLRNFAARTLQVIEPSGGGTTTYLHDKLGRLKEVTDAASPANDTDIVYDLAGRKTSMDDPDMGAWSYTYDAAGNLTSQTDARTVLTSLTYDALNRVTGKTYSGGSDPAVTFTYEYGGFPDLLACANVPGFSGDAWKGRLSSTTVGTTTRTLSCYDIRGRQAMSRTTVDAVNYDVKRTFDAFDQPSQVTYPDNEVVQYTLSSGGPDIVGMSSTTHGQTFFSGAAPTPFFAPADMTLGTSSERKVKYAYDYRMRLQTIKTGTTATPGLSQDLLLTYDNASNVTGVTDITTNEIAVYTPDDLNRLTAASGFTGGLSASYTYNTIGNMLTKTEGSSGLTLCYPDSGPSSIQPHAVTSVYNVGGAQCGVGTPWMTLAYDLNGNLLSHTEGGATTTFTFDAENRYKSRTAAGSTTTYSYNAHGVEVKRSKSDGTWTVYVDGVYEKTNTGAVKKYYPAYGRNVVMRDVPSGSGAGTLYYQLADHLGGTVELLDSAGATVTNSETKYWPYGATRSGAVTQTDKLFTGQRQESGDTLGLYNYKARFYSTTLGRFVSVDPVAGSAAVPQSWNGYSYVANNPLRYNDPTGRCASNPTILWNPCTNQPVTGPAAGLVYLASIGLTSPSAVNAALAARAAQTWANAVNAYLAASAPSAQEIQLWTSRAVYAAELAGCQGSIGCVQDALYGGAVSCEMCDFVLYNGAATVGTLGTGVLARGAGSLVVRLTTRQAGLTASEQAAGAVAGWGPPKPVVNNSELKALVDQLYRPGAAIGNGGTGDAVRAGAGHAQKAADYAIALDRWISRNPSAAPEDIHAAQSILQDLISAMGP